MFFFFFLGIFGAGGGWTRVSAVILAGVGRFLFDVGSEVVLRRYRDGLDGPIRMSVDVYKEESIYDYVWEMEEDGAYVRRPRERKEKKKLCEIVIPGYRIP